MSILASKASARGGSNMSDSLSDFADIGSLIREHASHASARTALICGEDRITYAALDARMDAVAAALQRDGIVSGEAIGICAAPSLDYACIFLGALRASVVVAPLAPGFTPQSLQRMLSDAGARLFFTAADIDAGEGGPPRIALDSSSGAEQPLAEWLANA